MFKFFIYIYIFFSILLIFFITFNHGRGSELSVMSQNNELLSSKDSNNILNKIILFLILFLIFFNFLISFYSNKIKSSDSLIVDLSKNFIIYKE